MARAIDHTKITVRISLLFLLFLVILIAFMGCMADKIDLKNLDLPDPVILEKPQADSLQQPDTLK